MIAANAPDLHQALTQGQHQGWAFVSLDGTLIESTRSSARSEAGHDLWYSGKHRRDGGNIQVLTDPSGYPVWTSPVQPGSVQASPAVRISRAVSSRVRPSGQCSAARAPSCGYIAAATSWSGGTGTYGDVADGTTPESAVPVLAALIGESL